MAGPRADLEELQDRSGRRQRLPAQRDPQVLRTFPPLPSKRLPARGGRWPSPSRPKEPRPTTTAVEDFRRPANYAPCCELRDLPVMEYPRPDRATDRPIDGVRR